MPTLPVVLIGMITLIALWLQMKLVIEDGRRSAEILTELAHGVESGPLKKWHVPLATYRRYRLPKYSFASPFALVACYWQVFRMRGAMVALNYLLVAITESRIPRGRIYLSSARGDPEDSIGLPYRRLVPATILGVLIVVGVLIYGVFPFIFGSGRGDYDVGQYLTYVGKAFVASIVITVKAYLSAVVLGFILAGSVYFLAEFGEVRLLPLFTELVDWVLGQSDRWVHVLYGVIWLLYSSASTFGELLSN